MASGFFEIRPVSRGRGGNAVAMAAYLARTDYVDSRTGTRWDFRRTPGLAYREFVLPPHIERLGPDWLKHGESLWNAAERAETRANARVARAYTLALPAELASPRRTALARDFARFLVERHGVAVDLTLHAPTSYGEARNHHAHLLATTREVTALGLGAKAAVERERKPVGPTPEPVWTENAALRQAFVAHTRAHLREAGFGREADAFGTRGAAPSGAFARLREEFEARRSHSLTHSREHDWGLER